MDFMGLLIMRIQYYCQKFKELLRKEANRFGKTFLYWLSKSKLFLIPKI